MLSSIFNVFSSKSQRFPGPPKKNKIDELGVPRAGLLDPFLRFISVCLSLFLVFALVSVRVSDSVYDLLVLCAF